MPGTYNGGGTVIGPGRPWRVEPTYDPPEPKPKQKSKSGSSLTQVDVLTGLGISKAMMKSKIRGIILKSLVAEGVLLDTGRPNLKNPKVVAIIKDMRKAKRR